MTELDRDHLLRCRRGGPFRGSPTARALLARRGRERRRGGRRWPRFRALVLFSIALAAAAVAPAQARGGHGSHVWHGHHSHHHNSFHHFGAILLGGFFIGSFYTQFPYGYPCLWEEGRWVNQVYEDRYGNTADVLEWSPGGWLCPGQDGPTPWATY